MRVINVLLYIRQIPAIRVPHILRPSIRSIGKHMNEPWKTADLLFAENGVTLDTADTKLVSVVQKYRND
jgi:hypothetical protein